MGKLVKTQTTLSGFSDRILGPGSPHSPAREHHRLPDDQSPLPLGGLRSLLNPLGTCPRDQLSRAKTGVRERGPEETGVPSARIPRRSSAGFGFASVWTPFWFFERLSLGERADTDLKGPPVERFGLGMLLEIPLTF